MTTLDMKAGDVLPGMEVRFPSGRYHHVAEVEPGVTKADLLERVARLRVHIEVEDWDAVGAETMDLPGLAWAIQQQGLSTVRLVSGPRWQWLVDRNRVVKVRVTSP